MKGIHSSSVFRWSLKPNNSLFLFGSMLVVSFFLILILFGWELGELGGKHFSPFLLFLGEEGEVGNTLSESAV